MNIEIKNLHYSAFASEETHCFEATVYVDGKRSFIAKNDGRGGCNDYHSFLKNTKDVGDVYQIVDRINAELKAQGPVSGPHKRNDGSEFYLYKDIDWVVNDLVNDALILKDMRRALKKIIYLHPDGSLRQMAANFKPTPDVLKAIKGASWWTDEYKLLNEMPQEEALKIWREAA